MSVYDDVKNLEQSTKWPIYSDSTVLEAFNAWLYSLEMIEFINADSDGDLGNHIQNVEMWIANNSFSDLLIEMPSSGGFIVSTVVFDQEEYDGKECLWVLEINSSSNEFIGYVGISYVYSSWDLAEYEISNAIVVKPVIKVSLAFDT